MLLLCGLPGMMNAYLSSVPIQDQWVLVKKCLPSLAMISTALVQPALAKVCCKIAKSGLTPHHLLLFANVVSWIPPLLIIVHLNENCAGKWWGHLEMCKREYPLKCDEILDGDPECRMTGPVDIASGAATWNGSHWVDMSPIVTTTQICAERWKHPERCTMSIIDALGPYLLAKALTACAMPLVFLLLSSMAVRGPPKYWTRRLPVLVIREEGVAEAWNVL